MDEFVCIISDTVKIKNNTESLFDLQFRIEIGPECLLDYSYYSVSSTKLPEMEIKLNDEEKEGLTGVFTRQRRQFKGLLKPYNLLKTIEELYLSLKYFTGGLKNFKVLEDFNKWIYY